MSRHGNKVRSEASMRMLAGERVEAVAGELGVSQATLYRWKHRALIDSGRKPGVKSYEPNELERARQRIKDLESELELVKAAAALSNGEEVQRPRGSGQSPWGWPSWGIPQTDVGPHHVPVRQIEGGPDLS